MCSLGTTKIALFNWFQVVANLATEERYEFAQRFQVLTGRTAQQAFY
jgi:hypothetical protein